MDRFENADPQQLLQWARDGDEAAFAHLLALYRNYLAVLARVHIDQQLQSKADRSDLVQETLMQAHKDFHQFRGSSEAELIAWLRKIMATKGAKLARRFYGTQRRDVQLERRLGEDLERSASAIETALADSALSPSQTAIRRERAVLLADALALLADDYCEVMILHHLEGRPMAEVAVRMGRSVNAVQKLWARALIKMRHIMGDEPCD